MDTRNYQAIGLMSGSSLDGLDIAYCAFEVSAQGDDSIGVNSWKLIKAATIPFSEKWKARLANLPDQSGLVFAKTHTYFGHYLAELVNEFLRYHHIEPDFIASHGHTIFHDPVGRMSIQIGDGAALAALSGYPVISGFRNQDVALNGEGAPVAPIVDRFLFQGHDFYLNLGGIANITSILPDKTIAFDICPANQLLDPLANQLGLEYDHRGEVASSGEILEDLLTNLNQQEFYSSPYPKSLDNAWSRQVLSDLLPPEGASVPDLLRTMIEHIAFQIAKSIREILLKENQKKEDHSIFVTGGGAFNIFLMERLKAHCQNFGKINIHIPEPSVIQFKEAVLMAWMGVLRVENQLNVL